MILGQTGGVARQAQPFAGRDVVGLRDQFNDAAKAKGAAFSNFDIIADVSAAAEDPSNKNKWATRPYASTLAAAMVSTANVASVAAAPPLYESLAFDPANDNSQLGPTSFFGVRSISGAGPFTVGTGGATQVGVAQNSGNAVRGRSNDGGTHPLELTTVAMGAVLAQALV